MNEFQLPNHDLTGRFPSRYRSEIEIMKRIAKMEMTIFTVSEFRRATDLSETAAQKLLER